MLDIVYFSSVSEYTRRFIDKVVTATGVTATRLPLRRGDAVVRAERPYLLVTPTYGGGLERSAVPKQVIRFLNDEANRALIRGVISCGNTNFGSEFCLAGDIVAAKCAVPHLARIELFGTEEDVALVRHILLCDDHPRAAHEADL